MSESSDPVAHDVRPLVRRIGKPPADWQREDLLRVCLRDGIRMVNFRYPALDGKLKELRLPVNGAAYLERILAAGERVDGSSLFPGLLRATESDLYVVPVYRWAFLDPWAEDELQVVCRFADRDGAPCAVSPDSVLAAAARGLADRRGLALHALAELEYYAFTRPGHPRFRGRPQRNYHQSSPYLASRPLLDEIVRVIAAVTGTVKYAHSEVGYIDPIESDDPEIDGCRVEQHELEFDLMPIEDLGCWLTVARWLIRAIADRHGATVTFLPKLDEGMAGSGMHLHLALLRDGANAMRTADGGLSDEALRLIGGLLEQAGPLTAFGSTVAASYLRLVPGQEAPTRICWGARNRASLVRVPLDFATPGRLDRIANPHERGAPPPGLARPTVEYRSPDGSAFPLPLLAAVAICAEAGLGSDTALETARRLEVRPGVEVGAGGFDQLPGSAVAAARALAAGRGFFEERGMPAGLIDVVVRALEKEDDLVLGERLRALPAGERLAACRRLMHKDLHKH